MPRIARNVLWAVTILAAMPVLCEAAVFVCPGPESDLYTERPDKPECRLLEIQPPELIYERQHTGMTLVKPSGPWPRGSAEAEAEFCELYQEWNRLDHIRSTFSFYSDQSPPPQGLTPRQLSRLHNLDLLFSHRGRPTCPTQ